MMRFLVCILYSIFLCSLHAEGVSYKKYKLDCDKPNLKTQEKLCSGSFNVFDEKKVSIRVVINESNQPSRYRNFDVWGADLQSAPATSFVSEIFVEIDGVKSGVPLSSFADLTNVLNISADFKVDKFILEVEGGETSTHYFASLTFDYEGFIIERQIKIPTFPNIGEKTVYSWNRLDN